MWKNQIKPLLNIVLRKTDERWLPEDVYAALQMETAYLWCAFNEHGRIAALSIFQVRQEFGEDCLFCWIGINLSKYHMRHFQDQYKEIARGAGCKRIVWESTRRGYDRVFEDAEIRSYRYEMEVD